MGTLVIITTNTGPLVLIKRAGCTAEFTFREARHDTFQRRTVEADIGQTSVMLDFQVSIEVSGPLVLGVTIRARKGRALRVSYHVLFHLAPVTSVVAAQIARVFPVTVCNA